MTLMGRWQSRPSIILYALALTALVLCGRLPAEVLSFSEEPSPPPLSLNARGMAAGSGAPLPADMDPTQPVIVRYRPGQERVAAATSAWRACRRLALDRSVAMRLTAGEIQRLAASGSVESIEPDAPRYAARAVSQASVGVTKASAEFGLSGDGDGDPTHYSTRDHTIVVIDTGIDGGHQDFAGGKIIAWQDFVNHRPAPYDDNGHGTHVASIAAGAVNGAGAHGVAPGAALIGLKVTDADGATTSSMIAEAVEWCITNKAKYGIEAINLSLAGPGPSDGTSADDRMVNRAVAAGIVVCVAAGNDGAELHSIGSPGAAADAVTVGNIADTGRDGFALEPSSSRGPTLDGRIKPDLCAPGIDILAAKANSVNGDVRYSGTSMAAPFVAGVVALMREADPALTAPAIKAILKETAFHFGRPGENNEYGAGRLDGYAALARAAGRAGTAPTGPEHLYQAGHLNGSGDSNAWEVPIVNTHFPVAAALIVETAGSDFDLTVYGPNGAVVRESLTEDRQELVAFTPTDVGTYRIVVTSYAGSGDYSLDLSAGAAAPLPARPSGLSVRPGSSRQLDLAWADESDNETAFAIWRKAGGGSAIRIGVVAPGVTRFSDRDVRMGVTYSYRVRATNNHGASAWSNEATGTPAPTPPAAPTGLAVSAAAGTRMDLAWQDRSGNETAFTIWRRSGTTDWTRVGVVAANVTRFADTTVTPSTTFGYRVRATNNDGASGWTSEVVGTTLPAAPAAPIRLSVSAAGPNRMSLTWTDNSSDETAFAIWRQVGAGEWTRIGVVGPNVTHFTDSGWSPGGLTTYRVRAINQLAASAWTNEARVGP